MLGTCLIGFALLMLVGPNQSLDFTGKGLASNLKIIALAVYLGLLGGSLIWSVYLLARYAVAFNKTRRQALSLFRESDLAAR